MGYVVALLTRWRGPLLALAVVALGLLLGGSVGLAAAPAPALTQMYLDGQKSFCDSGSMVEIEDRSSASGEVGFPTAESAVDAYLEESRSVAEAAPEELRRLLEPMREFTVELTFIDAQRGIAYFDSGTGPSLEARVTAFDFGTDDWQVVSVVRCEETVVTDLDAFKRAAESLRAGR